MQCMCNRSPPAGPSAVGARHVKEVRKGISGKCNRAAACASSREAAGSLGACTAGPTHPSVTSAAALGLACLVAQPASSPQFTVPSEPLTVNVLRMHMPAATCRSRVGPPRAPQDKPSKQPATLPAQAQPGLPNIAH